jgi:pimeloyl-ACP methyl ester carboxylesterase
VSTVSGEALQDVTVAPLFFDSHERPLYGLYCAPATRRPERPALVACHSFGLEHPVPSRMLGLVARRAAALGYPALVYHGRGHGDSAGDFAEVTFESMIEDALSAADEVCRRSGASSIIWLGVRFGGLVAAAASARHPRTAGLALWEPAHRGTDFFRQFLRGLLFAEVARGFRSGLTVDRLVERIGLEGRIDVHASPLYNKFYRSACAADLSQTLTGWSGPTLLAQVQPRLNLTPDHNTLVAALQSRGAKVTVARVREDPGWQFWRLAWTSPPLLEATGNWLHELV